MIQSIFGSSITIWGYVLFLLFFPLIIGKISVNYFRNLKIIAGIYFFFFVFFDANTAKDFMVMAAPLPLLLRVLGKIFPQPAKPAEA